MKKSALILLAILWAVALIGCGGAVDNGDGPPVTESENPQVLGPLAPGPSTLSGTADPSGLPIIRDLGEIPPLPQAPNGAPPAGAVFTALGTLSGGFSEAYAISSDGSTVTGTSVGDTGRIPFVWTAATGIQALPVTAAKPNGEGHALNQDGTVVGGIGIFFDLLKAQIWKAGAVQSVPGVVPPNLPPQVVSSLSRDGLIAVGTAGTGIIGYQGYRWVQGAPNPSGLGTLGSGVGQAAGSEGHGCSADGSVITGISTTRAGGLSAFRWFAGSMSALPALPDQPFSNGWAVSADGSTIVGYSFTPAGPFPTQATLWTASGPVSLGQLPGFEFTSQAYGVSADGSVVVGVAAPEQNFFSQTAFVWDSVNGMRSVQDLLGSAVPAGWRLLVATGVSDDGKTVAGFGVNPNGDIEAFQAQLP